MPRGIYPRKPKRFQSKPVQSAGATMAAAQRKVRKAAKALFEAALRTAVSGISVNL